MRMRTTTAAIAATATLMLGGARSSTAKPGAAKPAVDPEAVTALHKMGEFLRNQSAFYVQARATTDEVLPSGQKVQIGGAVEMRVRRPDRMRMDIVGDRRNQRLYYDGKTFTIFSERVNYYAAFPAPPTLAELKDILEKRYAVDLPLADLFYWGTDRDGTARIQAATRIGTANIDGFTCDHHAFRQKDVDWELWIEQGSRPLPRKLVITTTSEKSRPQHSQVLNWDLAPKLEDQIFTFVPPVNAHQIEFEGARTAARKSGATP